MQGSLKTFLIGAVILTLGFLIVAAGGHDFDLRFRREVPTQTPIALLSRYLGDLSLWPKWFFGLEDARYTSELKPDAPIAPPATGPVTRPVVAGKDVRLFMNPHKGPSRHYEIVVRIEQYEPGRLLQIRVLSDSKNKLTPLFDPLRWRIELEPRSDGTLIVGTEEARTSHWRSRLFGRIADQVLMNQAFYPDLFALARADQPEPAQGLMPDAVQGH